MAAQVSLVLVVWSTDKHEEFSWGCCSHQVSTP